MAESDKSLRYFNDTVPGFSRTRVRNKFVYRDVHNQVIREPAQLARISGLAIPPAWEKVWICPSPSGHLQATGRDSKGRKQYRYHTAWSKIRDESKYARMSAFGKALPAIRKRVSADLARAGLPREKVLATIVRLLERTRVRVGNREYAKANGSFGLTTLRNRHVNVAGAKLRLNFRGKGGKPHTVAVKDEQLAKIVRRCRDLPGYELFQYLDENHQPQAIDSSDVNAYLREITSQDFTAKDFRTWAGTLLAVQALAGSEEFTSKTRAKKNIVEAIKVVAERLRNTPAICRKSYIHPVVFDAYSDGSLSQMCRIHLVGSARPSRLESLLLRLLRRRKPAPDAPRVVQKVLPDPLKGPARRRPKLSRSLADKLSGRTAA
jgi:DNA topoisomerase I